VTLANLIRSELNADRISTLGALVCPNADEVDGQCKGHAQLLPGNSLIDPVAAVNRISA
jgi:hypothetical protein